MTRPGTSLDLNWRYSAPCCLTSCGTTGVASGTAAAGLAESVRHPEAKTASDAAAHATNATRFERIRIIDSAVLRSPARARLRRPKTGLPPVNSLRARRNCVARLLRGSQNRSYPTDRRLARL